MERLCRYLVGLPRMIYLYSFQEVDHVDVYTDTDWNGCPRTRKSTSGGCALLGRHTIKTWSSTQTSIALSSGEAEFNGVVRGAGVGLGYQSLLRDLGQDLPVRVWTDSSAAIGIASRQGLGRLRHLDTHTLWVQQAVRSKRIDLRYVCGDVNPADVFTKHSISRERLIKLVKLFECTFRGGRAESAPQTRRSPGSKVTMAQAEEGDEIHAMGLQSAGAKGGPTDPVMPHREHGRAELDRLYPPIDVPDDDHNELQEREDDMVKAGEKVIKDIMEDAEARGRRRCAEQKLGPTRSNPGTGARK